jgi:hypothetical protein
MKDTFKQRDVSGALIEILINGRKQYAITSIPF